MPSPNISELATTTIESRRRRLADNVSDNTALLSRLKKKGKIRTVDGGRTIFEELEYAENATYKRISGYDLLNVQPSDVMTAAEYDPKEVAVAITINERERRQNSGRARMIDLMERRIGNAEKSMVNGLSGDLYSDGTADGGKQVGGLDAALSTSPATGTYGGIPRESNEFWRHQYIRGATDQAILLKMMLAWVATCRNTDQVDLIPADNIMYINFWNKLVDKQRFTDPGMARSGFTSLKFDTADVVLDGGVGGSAPDGTMFFLNTDYIHWRPYRDSNMVPLDDRRPVNQAALAKIIYWMGNLTLSNAQLHARVSQA